LSDRLDRGWPRDNDRIASTIATTIHHHHHPV
jgi:hypothetical protein